ncbi:MAG: hypothetical protein U0990_04400 [Candidatus Nanopelagicales bacterium]|nr:hypothetical protein [Candidatus Nanopelagicales bacterium]MDZ4249312.1 hypothetical protein [Candidatus Nanopelagicales bacterium]
MSLNAIATPSALEPGPLVTLVRSRTVANTDSIVHRYLEASSRGVLGGLMLVQRVAALRAVLEAEIAQNVGPVVHNEEVNAA